MTKTLDNRNMVNFYVKNEYKDIFKRFCEIIEKDNDFKALQSKKNRGLMSIAINELVSKYVAEKLQEEENVETD